MKWKGKAFHVVCRCIYPFTCEKTEENIGKFLQQTNQVAEQAARNYYYYYYWQHICKYRKITKQ